MLFFFGTQIGTLSSKTQSKKVSGCPEYSSDIMATKTHILTKDSAT